MKSASSSVRKLSAETGGDLDGLRELTGLDVAGLDESDFASAVAGLAAGIALLAAKSLEVVGRLAPPDVQRGGTDDLVDVHEAARLLGMSEKWVYRHAEELAFTVRVGRSLRFSRRGIERFRIARAV